MMAAEQNKPWKNKKRSPFRETGSKGKPKKAFLIVCEGEKTEPQYFECFRVPSSRINIIPTGSDPVRIVDRAINEVRKRELDESRTNYDEVWCVFDKDSVLPDDFRRALMKAESNSIFVAYSNQAFEIWYLLHFHFFHTGMDRNTYIDKLNKLIDGGYRKNDPDLYDKLISRQAEAIRNAKRLLQEYNPQNPAFDDPSTTVHKLVIELNKNKF